ncbi:MAG: hypothetical protein J1E41_04225, partial [Ruminococcus sp.]|nr:hypothetical protein [Ruminococcus sp.]
AGNFFTRSISAVDKTSRILSASLGLGVQMLTAVVVYVAFLAILRDNMLFEFVKMFKNAVFDKLFHKKA